MADPLQVVAVTAAGLALTELYEAPLHLLKNAKNRHKNHRDQAGQPRTSSTRRGMRAILL